MNIDFRHNRTLHATLRLRAAATDAEGTCSNDIPSSASMSMRRLGAPLLRCPLQLAPPAHQHQPNVQQEEDQK